MPDGSCIFVTEHSFGSSQHTSRNSILEPFFPGIGIINIPSPTEFLVTLYILEPFSKEK
jgi:hypothetical protein